LLELERLAEIQDVAFESESTAALAQYAQRRRFMVALAGFALAVGLVIAYVIIRRSRQAEASLQAEKERVLVTLYSIGEAVITTDRDGRIDILNAVAERLTGYTADSARGRPFAEVVELRHGDSQQPANELAEQALVSGCVVRANGDLVLVTPRGDQRAVELTSSPIRDQQGRISGAVHVLGDVTALRAMGRELAYHATHDSLTGLLNRRELENRLQIAIERSDKGHLEHALLYVDLDLFQVVNDTAGHIAGDELLKEIAGLLTSQARSSDCIARMGGDEFAILIQACPAQEAVLAAKALRNGIKALRFEWNGRRFEVGASIGVVPIGADSGSVSEVLRTADLACYVAKDSGRNRVHLFEPDDAALVHREGEMQRMHEVRDALANGSFTLFQQVIEPIGASENGRLMSEILLRMRAPSGELVEPQAFLPAAEHYQLGPMVDRWVIAETLQAVRLLRERPGMQDAVFSINISGQSLDDAGFIEFVLGALRDSGAAAEAICFEITETAAIGHMSRARELVGALKAIGCLFALDDFGSGSSSFAYLKKLPVDFLKIDGQFVRDIARDKTDLALVESINQIGHVMGIKTIAEYVEDEQVKRLLEQIGVDFAQGEAIARPAPLALLFDHHPTGGSRPQLISV
jgi:diguanylate cyclase (GGDEF)-like protein/PAS domain S-box-containing protein